MFTPLHSFLGGSLLFLASQQYSILLGRTFGCSAILSRPFADLKASIKNLQLQSLAGLLCGALVVNQYAAHLLVPADKALPGLGTSLGVSLGYAALAGLFVGLGTKLANGCTSGHMLNGVARLSKRSLIATISFFSSAVATVWYLQTAPQYTLSSPAYRISPLDTQNARTLFVLVGSAFAASALLAAVLRESQSPAIARSVTAFSAGVNFSAGLLISGMAQPQKTLGFLNLTSPTSFEPSLLMIVLGGLIPNFIAYQFVDNAKPWLDSHFHVAKSGAIDAKLVIGSVLFGCGWGSYGICPGPAVVGLATPTKEIVTFVFSSVVGSRIVEML